MGSKERLEKAIKSVEKVKDEQLREHLQSVVDGLDIIVSCIEPENFSRYIEECEKDGNSLPIKKALKRVLFGHQYYIQDIESCDEEVDYEPEFE